MQVLITILMVDGIVHEKMKDDQGLQDCVIDKSPFPYLSKFSSNVRDWPDISVYTVDNQNIGLKPMHRQWLKISTPAPFTAFNRLEDIDLCRVTLAVQSQPGDGVTDCVSQLS